MHYAQLENTEFEFLLGFKSRIAGRNLAVINLHVMFRLKPGGNSFFNEITLEQKINNTSKRKELKCRNLDPHSQGWQAIGS